jgi:hypothetical protein
MDFRVQRLAPARPPRGPYGPHWWALRELPDTAAVWLRLGPAVAVLPVDEPVQPALVVLKVAHIRVESVTQHATEDLGYKRIGGYAGGAVPGDRSDRCDRRASYFFFGELD